MVLLKRLMKIAPPQMGESMEMMMTMVSPTGREVLRRNLPAGGQNCSCPSSASRRWRFVPKVLPSFFLGSMTYILEGGYWRWARLSTTHQGAPGGPSAPRWVVPTWVAPSSSYLLQYSLYIPQKFSVKFQLIWSCAE
jgi:hypothetical protein